MTLFERERELKYFEGLIKCAPEGQGRSLVVEGEAGIGKTTLLEAFVERAAEAGIQCAIARGGELEHDLPFAIVRQLFEPVLRAGSPAFKAEMLSDAAGLAAPIFGAMPQTDGVAENTAAIVHGLYWLCSNIAEQAPLLLVVDDAHWADRSSLRFISHLARRLSDLPVLLVLATHPGQWMTNLNRALTGVKPDVLQLFPLSNDAISTLVRAELGAEAEEIFCAACAEATRGNPFLLTEALIAVRAKGLSPMASAAPNVPQLSSDTVTRSILARLARHGKSAETLARWVAVLGPDAQFHRVAELSKMSREAAARIIDELQHDSILAGESTIRFVHPLLRSAVYDSCFWAVRAGDHKQVASILQREGAPISRLVPHLLAAENVNDDLVVDALMEAAGAALAAGSPEVAAQCLRRALAEPARQELRGSIQFRLGRALGFANQFTEAEAALESALSETDDPLARADVALEMGWLRLVTGRASEAKQTLSEALSDCPAGSPQERRLQAMCASAGTMAFDDPVTWAADVTPDPIAMQALTLEERLMLATTAVAASMSGNLGAKTVGNYAAAAVTGEAPPRERWLITAFAGPALALSDRSGEAIDAFGRAQAASQAEGDAATYRYLAMLRSHFWYYAGNLLESEADARAALELASTDDPGASSIVVWSLVNVLVERGRLDEAEQILSSHGLDGDLPAVAGYAAYTQFARGRLRLAQGKLDLALIDLQTVGDTLTAGGYLNPGFVLWRTEVAATYLAMGRVVEARSVAEEEVALARRFGAPRAIGISLRTLALTENSGRRIELLTESVRTLGATDATVEHARSLVDLGVALRVSQRRADAVEALRQGLDLATTSHADVLVDRARLELVASGARPRRNRSTGPDSLTAGEYRVVSLAVEGYSNSEIAQRLFVSRRTVEMHLTNAFRKLHIDSRQGLATALAER